jgi:hypothetical protein
VNKLTLSPTLSRRRRLSPYLLNSPISKRVFEKSGQA